MKRRTFNKQIADQAAEWVVRFDDGPLDASEREGLVAWLKESPAHVDEFLTSLALFESTALADPDMSTAVSDLLLDASPNIVPIGQIVSDGAESAANDFNAPPSGRRWRKWFGGGIAAATVMTVMSVSLVRSFDRPTDETPGVMIVATELGEQRSVTLDDGSIVYVNTQSQISAHFTDEARTVNLAYGEALFDVEHDPNRPFRVIAGDTVAEALGTTFNVRFIDNQAAVSVVEGTVAFSKKDVMFDAVEQRNTASSDAASSDDLGRIEMGRVILTAGQRVDLTDQPVPTPTVASTNVDSVTAWTSRKLVFDELDLVSIAAEFNRYNRDRIILESSLLGGERFSGTFAADDPESFVAFLELTSDVTSRKRGNEIRLRDAQ